jgi:hypothetical protein
VIDLVIRREIERAAGSGSGPDDLALLIVEIEERSARLGEPGDRRCGRSPPQFVSPALA